MLSGLPFGSGAVRTAYAAVDDEMRDVHALRRQFPRHALRQAAQRELAHREGRRVRIALHAGRRAGQQDRPRPARDHVPRRLLRHQETAIGADRDRARDVGRDRGRSPGRAPARWRCRRRYPARPGWRSPPRTGRRPPRVRWPRRRRWRRRFPAASFCSLSGLRDAIATCNPCCANSRASEALRPGPTPTINAVFMSISTPSGDRHYDARNIGRFRRKQP